jgi:hypothetical protein
MRSFTRKQNELCLSIVDLLESKPISAVFRRSVTSRVAGSSSQTLSLQIIRNLVARGELDDLAKFTDVMERWFSLNTVRKNSIKLTAILELRRIYEKRITFLRSSTDNVTWVEHCGRVRGKIDDLLRNAPTAAQFPWMRLESRVAGPAEWSFIVSAARRIVSAVDLFHVTSILANDPIGPDLRKQDLRIDLKGLHTNTVFTLFDWLRGRFPDEPYGDIDPTIEPEAIT